ncbi:MAG TPA: hypothetical protein VE032_02325 [Actinomycetota bacterium]|nr:hypothetical protein [Actinomycetota bacterium]
MRPRHLLAPLMIMAVSACTGGTTSPATAGTTTSPAPAGPTTTTAPPVSPTALPSLPAGIPPGFEDDVDPGDVPVAALIPLRGRVSGSWVADTAAGPAIVVAWTMPSGDPFAAPGGVAAWRRFDDGGSPWRPVWGESWKTRDAVLGVAGEIADLTGDGSPDVLLSLGRGGSGACLDVRGVDPASGALVFVRDGLCDATVAPGAPGMVLTEAVYAPGDAHCCPSQLRTTELAYAGGRDWVVTSETLTDL